MSSRRGDSVPTLERATKFNPMFESDPVTAQYYRRYDDQVPQYYHRRNPDLPPYSSSDGASKDLSSDEIRNIYQNTTLSREVVTGLHHFIQTRLSDQTMKPDQTRPDEASIKTRIIRENFYHLSLDEFCFV